MSLKNITSKVIAALVSIYLVLGNCAVTGLGIVEAIAEDIQTPKLAIEQSFSKYIQYEKENYKGTVVQTNVSIKEEEGIHIPISNMGLELKVPSINGVLPDRVSIIKANTILTNGTENNSVGQDYSKNTGLLNISYENKEVDGKIYSEYKENAKDEFEIIYIYPESAYIAENNPKVLVQEININATYKVNKETLNLTAKSMISESMVADSEDVINYEIKNVSEIYKGFMYSNETNKTNYATDYKEISEMAVFNSEIIDTIKVRLEKTVFNLNNNTELDTGSIQYRYTRISENDFNKVFGQDGELDFYLGNTKYAAIKYGEPDDKGNRNFVTEYYTQEKQNIEAGKVEYPIETVSVRMESSKPVNEGKIYLENLKQIVSESNYGVKVSELKNIKETRSVIATKNNQEDRIINIASKTNKYSIELKEPSTQISFELSNNKLSTLTTNKITATVKINDTNSSCKLVNGGNIELTLPDNTANANIISAKSLYENGISIKKAKVENEKVILEISGKQTTYDTLNISGGVNIVLDLEIDIADTVATHKENINLSYNNVQVSKEIEIVSKYGLLMESKIKNETKNTDVITIINSNRTIETAINDTKQVENIELNVVNNYENEIANVQISGALGNSSEKNITYDVKLERAITLSKGKVLYSVDNNNWQETYNANAKYFKIVLDNNKLSKGDSVKAIIKLSIPANLDFNEVSYIKYETAYNNGEQINKVSSIIMFATEKDEFKEEIETNEIVKNDSNIELSITPVITQNYVHAGQKVSYKITVKNISNQTINNIIVHDIIPENSIYTYKVKREGIAANYLEEIKDDTKKDLSWKITSLAPNAEQEIEFMITVKENITEQQDLLNKVNITYDGQQLYLESKVTIRPSLIVTDLTTVDEKIIGINYSEDEIVEYHVRVKNISNRSINNVTVQYAIPKNMKYVEGGLGIYNEFNGYNIEKNGKLNNNIFEYKINKLNVGEENIIVIRCKVEKLSNIYEADISGIVNILIDNDIYQTNLKTIKTIQSAFTIKLQSNRTETEILKKDDEVIYTITVKNIGKASGGFNIKDSIPEQIIVNSIEYYTNSDEKFSYYVENNEVEVTNSLEVGKTLTIKIHGKVKEIKTSNEEIINIINSATLDRGSYNIKSNEISLQVKTEKENTINTENEETNNNNESGNQNNDNQNTPDNPSNPDNPDNPSNSDESTNLDNSNSTDKPSDQEINTYSLSGVAWLDSNKDGKRDESEKLLSGIKVYLVDSGTGKVVTDSDGNEINVLTGENGEYKFDGISEGLYLVLFEFDTNKYKATRYQTPNVSSTLNSDVIISKVTIDGNEKIVGATNVLELKADVNNIDIGLIENAEFDLSLEKQISKISVITTQGTKTTEYENINFAKVDLVAKYMNNTSVIVTYKFIIRNNGDVTGYVDSLQDDLPKGLEFSSELNKDWYKGSDGKLYTEALSKTAIEPGKSSEIELILTKETTEESTGTFTNNAELAKISNIEAVDEIQKDNNKSSADLVISIKTGSPMLYIGITLVSIAIIAVGSYVIKKKVLNMGI